MCTSLYCTVLYCTLLYCTLLYCTVLYRTVLHSTILYTSIFYCIVLYCTVLYYTILYYTLLYFSLLYCVVMYRTVNCSEPGNGHTKKWTNNSHKTLARQEKNKCHGNIKKYETQFPFKFVQHKKLHFILAQTGLLCLQIFASLPVFRRSDHTYKLPLAKRCPKKKVPTCLI